MPKTQIMKNNLRLIIEKKALEKGSATLYFPEIVSELKANVDASSETINRLLRDDNQIPRRKLITQISNFLEIPAEELISIS